MNSYDFIEIFTILQGLKRNLLNKEELLQITRIGDMEELFKRLKALKIKRSLILVVKASILPHHH